MEHTDPNSLTITLSAEQIERLDEAVQSGNYGSREEVVLAALKVWGERRALNAISDDHLKEAYEAGLASGEAVSVDIRDLRDSFKAARHARG